MDNNAKPSKPNPRRDVAAGIRTLSEQLSTLVPGATLAPDATNPYAFVVTAADKRFRVIVKDLD